MDMRFAGPDAQFGAPEASLGLIHVGGLQHLVRLIGPGRAAEYMLAAAQVSASEEARVGWVNSVYPTAEALHAHVDNLAVRIALFPIEAIQATRLVLLSRPLQRQPWATIIHDSTSSQHCHRL
ncbi:ClpP/crotonase-like domain-containing protein [Trichoderma sp. SZMC 28014]